MKWNNKLPTKTGYYICTYEEYGELKVGTVVWTVDYHGYIRPDTRNWEHQTYYAWMPFPKWDDDGWNEVPHYTDNTKWRDYCPTEDGEYIVKSISGWKPHQTKSIHTQRFQDGTWRTYPNKPMEIKHEFVYGWMQFPKPFDAMYQLPIFDYQRAIGLNDEAKEHLKKFYEEHNVFSVVGDKRYKVTFNKNEGFIKNETTL